jgi:hypothetical protein
MRRNHRTLNDYEMQHNAGVGLLRNSMAILVSNVLKLMVIERNQAYSPYKRVPFGYMAMCGLKKLFTRPSNLFLIKHPHQ